MLSKKEKTILFAIYKCLNNRKSCLVTIVDLYENIDAKEKKKIKQNEISHIIDELTFDGYIDSVVSVNNDKTYYCISSLKKGDGFKREEQQNHRALVKRTVVTVVFAVLSFAITMVLRAIFL